MFIYTVDEMNTLESRDFDNTKLWWECFPYSCKTWLWIESASERTLKRLTTGKIEKVDSHHFHAMKFIGKK